MSDGGKDAIHPFPLFGTIAKSSGEILIDGMSDACYNMDNQTTL